MSVSLSFQWFFFLLSSCCLVSWAFLFDPNTHNFLTTLSDCLRWVDHCPFVCTTKRRSFACMRIVQKEYAHAQHEWNIPISFVISVFAASQLWHAHSNARLKLLQRLPAIFAIVWHSRRQARESILDEATLATKQRTKFIIRKMAWNGWFTIHLNSSHSLNALREHFVQC